MLLRTLSGHLTITVSNVLKVIITVRVTQTSAGADQNYKWVGNFWLCSVAVESFKNILRPLHLTFALRSVGSLSFSLEILCWAPWISQVQSTGLPFILKAQPCVEWMWLVSCASYAHQQVCMCQMGIISMTNLISQAFQGSDTTVDRRAVISLIKVCERNYFTGENKNRK